VLLYLCGAPRRRQRRRLPPGELAHLWQPAEPPERQTAPASWTPPPAPARGGTVLTGEGPSANPEHAERGAGPGAVAVERKNGRSEVDTR